MSLDKIAKIEELVRAGLMPVQTIPFLRKAMHRVEQDELLTLPERRSFYQFCNQLLDIVLGDSTIYRMVKQRSIGNRHTVSMKETVSEASTGVKSSVSHSDEVKAQVAKDMEKRRAARRAALDSAQNELNTSTVDKKVGLRKMLRKESAEHVVEDVEMKKAPEGMLITFSKIVKTKLHAGGKPTEGDRKLASKAKSELRRRRNVASKRMAESTEHKVKLETLMAEYGIQAIEDLPDDKKAEFFSQL